MGVFRYIGGGGGGGAGVGGLVVVGKGRFTYNSIVLCVCIGCKCVQLGTFNRLARRALDSEAGASWIQKRLVQEEHGGGN